MLSPSKVVRVAQRDEGIRRVGLIGLGTIGVSWTVLFARAGLAVTAWDPDATQRSSLASRIDTALRPLAEAGLPPPDVEVLLEKVRVVDSLKEAVNDVEYVQESVPE